MKPLFSCLILWLAGITASAQLVVTWDAPTPADEVEAWEVWSATGRNAPTFQGETATNSFRFTATPTDELLVFVYGRNGAFRSQPTATLWRPTLPPSPSNIVTLATVTQTVAQVVTVTNQLWLTNLITVTQTNWVTATNVAPIVELVTNGGFENGTNGWVFTGNVNTFTASSAGYSVASGVRAVAYNQGQRLPDGTVSQIISTVAGRAYTLKFNAGLIAFKKIQQTLAVTVRGTTNLLSQTVALPLVIATNAVYQTRSFPFVADGSSAVLTFRDASAGSDSVDLLLDNVSVK